MATAGVLCSLGAATWSTPRGTATTGTRRRQWERRVAGEGRHYTAFGIVTTDGIDFRDSFLPDELFRGAVRVSA